MALTFRQQLDRERDALEQTLSVLGRKAGSAFDFDAYQEKVDQLVVSADAVYQGHGRERSECMPGSAGLISSENEGVPCP